MANSKQIVYLSQAQYAELIANGTITVNGVTVTYDENDIYVTPQAEPVTDVRVAGTSVTANGVANIPPVLENRLGVIRIGNTNGWYGIKTVNDSGVIGVQTADNKLIKAGTYEYKPITPFNQEKSTFYGLAKAAGHDEKDSTEPLGTYTPEAKGAIQKMLGVSDLIATEENDLTASKPYAIGDIFTANGKLYKATAAIAQDAAIILPDGVGANCEETNLVDESIKDVQVNGTSIIGANGAANIPVVQARGQTGAVRINLCGLTFHNDPYNNTQPKVIGIDGIATNDCKVGSSYWKVAVPAYEGPYTFYGLATAAGASEKNSTLPYGTYTPEAKEAIQSMIGVSDTRKRVLPLTNTEITKYTTLEVIGTPPYIKDSDLAQYSEYGITESGWYLFARIMAENGVVVSEETSVEGAKAIITTGADHVDIAVLFDVAAVSQKIVVHWDESNAETFVFKATDLAVRNLDYRTTFYVYDLAPFTTWAYALTADTVFDVTKNYFVKDGDTYTAAEVQTEAYVLTADATFATNKTYYTKNADTYEAATVTAGEAVPADTYYEKTTVPVPAYYKQVNGYVLTSDATFQEGVTYFIKNGDEYVEAEVTVGDAVTANTYYVPGLVWIRAEDGAFQPDVTYYTKSGTEYTEAQVTVGDVCPAYYKHSKVTFEGMTRNVTYVLNDEIDCPSEFILPEIEDETHGCWYEFRFHHSGSFSSTLVPPEGVKVATEHTQAETAGVNMVDLHYTAVDGVKIWRFMNTHSSIPA